MEYQDIFNVVKQHSGAKFKITLNNGYKTAKRLFISSCGNICEFKGKSRTRGYIMNTTNVISLEMIEKGGVALCRRNLENVVKYLSSSGLWQPMLKGAKLLLSLDNDTLSNLDYNKFFTDLGERGIKWFGIDCFYNLFEKPIKTMNFHSWERTREQQIIRECISEKKRYFKKWVKGYDNSCEMRFDDTDGVHRAWYSEEYKGCANGHYYFMLDDKHAIFGEDD